MKVVEIKASQNRAKNSGKKGRPLVKVKEEVAFSEEAINENACKICYEEECICGSSISSSDVDRNIGILSDRAYLKLINCIGQLNVDENFTWIRST
jgi:hypothetical protein